MHYSDVTPNKLTPPALNQNLDTRCFSLHKFTNISFTLVNFSNDFGEKKSLNTRPVVHFCTSSKTEIDFAADASFKKKLRVLLL